MFVKVAMNEATESEMGRAQPIRLALFSEPFNLLQRGEPSSIFYESLGRTTAAEPRAIMPSSLPDALIKKLQQGFSDDDPEGNERENARCPAKLGVEAKLQGCDVASL